MFRPSTRTLAALLALLFIAAACASPAESPAATASALPTGTEAPGAGATEEVAADPRVIEIEATGEVEFTQDGQRLTDIPVTPGETVIFRITNTAGFPHNFTIGTDTELSVINSAGQAGTQPWRSGVQELEWTVPDDISGLRFGCTVRGHYTKMQGAFSVA